MGCVAPHQSYVSGARPHSGMCKFMCVRELTALCTMSTYEGLGWGLTGATPPSCVYYGFGVCVQHLNVCVGWRDLCPYVHGSIYVCVFMKPYVEGCCELQTQHVSECCRGNDWTGVWEQRGSGILSANAHAILRKCPGRQGRQAARLGKRKFQSFLGRHLSSAATRR